MKAQRVDQTTIRLIFDMTPDEAEALRSLVQNYMGQGVESETTREVRQTIFDAIGRVF